MEQEKIPESGVVDKSKLYIGELKVSGYGVVGDEETPSGGRIIEVSFDDGSVERYTEAKFDAIKSYKKSDATAARDRLVKEAGKKMYALLMEFGPALYEVDHILNEAVRLANDATEQALNVLWGKDHPSKRNLLDVNAILSKHYGEHPEKTTNKADGASSK